MAKEHTDRSDEITDPQNPPRVLLKPEARRAALWSYLGPVIALFVIVGVAMIYWVNRGPLPREARTDEAAIGTVGRDAPGGGDPQGSFKNTGEELKHRGVRGTDEDTIRSIGSARNGDDSSRRVVLDKVTVDAVDGSVTWVKDGSDRIAVVTDSASGLKSGDEASVSGTTERDSQGNVRIRGTVQKK
jgi:hypothetical protein